MQLTTLFTAALLALGVTAAPGSFDDNTAALESRTYSKCKLGEIYNAHFKTCTCPPGQQYLKYKCRYPALKEPQCGKDQWGNKEYKYCSKSKAKWALYHEDFAYCEDDGINIAWCSSLKNFKDNLAKKYDDQYKFPVCKDKQEWNGEKKACECFKGYEWKQDEQKCKYPVVQKPDCTNKPAWCGKSKSLYCKYDLKRDECENDGSSWSFCVDDKDVRSYTNKEFDL